MTPTDSGIDPVRWWKFVNGVDTVPAEAIPDSSWGGWEAKYSNPCEVGKRTTRDVKGLPSVARILAELQSPESVRMWCDLLGYAVLPDPTGWGGGLHVTGEGGELGAHLDFDRHPKLPAWRRALNIIAFIHHGWSPAWGGDFCLCDPMGKVVRRFTAWAGEVIAFECSDLSYHLAEPVTGPAERVSVAAYFLSPATAANTRQRALFLPSR